MLVTFQPGQTQQSVNIGTSLDPVSEDTESFTLVLSSPSSPRVTLGSSQANVDIVDTTNVVLEFDPTQYLIAESGGMLQFRIVKRTPTTRTVSVLFSTESDTAVGKELHRELSHILQ